MVYTTLMTVKRKKKVFVPLCFTAQEANSTVKLNKTGTPTAVNLETSTDGITWTDYTIGNVITLANVGDKVYMRNKSETDTGFSIDGSKYYQFAMTGKIGASGDVTSLLNKNGTTTLCEDCFYELFGGCASLTTTPELSATTLANGCYSGMFDRCTNLTTLPELPATTLAIDCYGYMFIGCTGIKLSETQTGEYQTPYRIPTTGTGTDTRHALTDMFAYTGGTFTGTPEINTTYYLSNGIFQPTPGIYHNPSLGLISLSSDGENWITIADKNLGATEVYEQGDSQTFANGGYGFQWGNNYGVPYGVTSGITISPNEPENLSSYGPGNYLNNNMIYDIMPDAGEYPNLWGGETGTNEGAQGPCESGFHVPFRRDILSLLEICKNLSILQKSIAYKYDIVNNNFNDYLKMTHVVFGSIQNGNIVWSDMSNEHIFSVRGCGFDPDEPMYSDDWNTYISSSVDGTGLGYCDQRVKDLEPIRPFKNEPVVPTSERIVLYQPN